MMLGFQKMYVSPSIFLEVFQVWTPNMAQNAKINENQQKIEFLNVDI